MDQRKIDAICDPAIGTAQSILDLAARNPKAVSLILRGTAGKYLRRHDGLNRRLSRCSHQEDEKPSLQALYPGHSIPLRRTPTQSFDEEVIELADYALKRFAYLRTHEAEALARRLLALFQKYSIGPSQAKKQINTLSKFVPDYKPEPDLRAQFIPHLTLAEQLQAFDQDHRHKKYLEQARALMKMPPAGHA